MIFSALRKVPVRRGHQAAQGRSQHVTRLGDSPGSWGLSYADSELGYHSQHNSRPSGHFLSLLIGAYFRLSVLAGPGGARRETIKNKDVASSRRRSATMNNPKAEPNDNAKKDPDEWLSATTR